MVTINLTKQFTKIITQIKNGEQLDISLNELEAAIEELTDNDEKELYRSILALAKTNKALPKWNIKEDNIKSKVSKSDYSELLSQLKFLNWQFQRISEGDLDQHNNSLSEFSNSVNKLITSIKHQQNFESELKKSEQKFKTIVDTSPDGMIITNLNGAVEFATSKVVEMMGYLSPKELIGRNIQEFVHSSYSNNAKFFHEEIIKGNEIGAAEFLIVRKDKSQFYCEANANVLRDENNKPIGALYMEREISQRKQVEELNDIQIEQLSELNATKDKFFRIIAHDLKNPFHSLLGLSNLMVDAINNKHWEEITEYTQAINQLTKQTYKLLENLLEWSQLQSGRLKAYPQKITPSAIIGEVILQTEQLSKNKNIELLSDIDFDEDIFGDKEMIKTVLRNLITNAIKFTHKGGQVKITTQSNNGDLLIKISDNGIGIQKEYVEQLFRIDNNLSETGTANETGTGLGLILCKELVQINNGIIWAESEIGKGSDFIFTIPLKQINK